MLYKIPGVGNLELKTLILDLNGTLTVKGIIPVGVKERIIQLKEKGYKVLFLQVILVTMQMKLLRVLVLSGFLLKMDSPNAIRL